jgi:hypothetical protein
VRAVFRRGCGALAALALLLPAPATAASAAKQAVVRVVKSYQTALLDGDGKKACSLLTKAAQAKLVASVPGSARTHASAKLLSGRKLLLAKVGRRWLISDPSLRG